MIQIKDVWKSFADNHVLRGVNLEVQRGDTMVVMGRSGCGKSILLKLIVGLMKPDTGEIWVDGKEITKLKEKNINDIRKNIGMLFQSAALFDSMDVFENVAFMLLQHTHLSKQEIREIVAEKLELVELPGIEELKPAELSGGMRKRVGLARALAINPDIVLYDEPTTGLDPITAEEINILIKSLSAKLKITSIAVTHDMKSAFTIATRMAMMHQGKIIATGTPEEMKRIEEPIVRNFISGTPER
ncbi:ABC transporter ATP-binding protein [Candidatus Poribacteria bacterium]|nr:ABC transporter ATP-binding protein [Candidatus Poribacteria bacterium]